MPRIPLAPTYDGPAPGRGPRLPMDNSGAQTAAAIGQAGAQIANTLFDFAALEQKKRQAGVDAESKALETEAEYQLAVQDSTLRTVEQDPDAYKAASAKLADKVLEDLRKSAKYREAATSARLDRARARYLADAYKHSDTLLLTQNEAQLRSSLDKRTTLAGVATDDEDWRAHLKGGLEEIEARRTLRGGVWVEKEKQAFEQDILTARAMREADTAPVGFLADAETRYMDLDPKKREELKKHARNRVEEIQREATQRREKAEKQAAEISETNRQYRLMGLTDAASKHELSRQQVIDARERGDIHTDTEYRHYMTLATKGTAIESDPVLWSQVQADVWSSQPTYTEKRITALMARATEGGVGLSGEHGRMALSELNRKRSEATATGQTQQNEARRLANDAYTRAKEEALRALGITTPLSQLTKDDAKLVSDFERTFNALVLDAAGNVRTDVAVRQVMVDTLPAFHNRKGADTRLSYQQQADIVRELTGSTPPDIMDPAFLQWFSQQVKAAEGLAADPKTLNLYKLRRDQLLKLSRTRHDFLQAEARKAAAATTGSKRTGGYSAQTEGGN